MGKRIAFLLIAIVRTTSAFGGFTDGFETGTLDPAWVAVWSVYPAVVTSADSGRIRPHSGTYMAYTPQGYTVPCVRHSVGTAPSAGTMTAYVNSYGFNSNYIFSIAILNSSGTTIRVLNNGTALRVYSPYGDTTTSITITSRTWHEVKFVTSPVTGTNVYWDSTLIRSNDTSITTVDKVEFGTSWGCALAAYDDFSFIPSIADGNVTTLTGTVIPEGFTGNLQDVCVRIELIQDGNVIRMVRTNLDAAGKFVLTVVPNDIYDIGIQSYGHLRKVLTGRDLIRPSTDLGTITLTSGDVEGNNSVTATDLSIVLANLDQAGDL